MPIVLPHQLFVTEDTTFEVIPKIIHQTYKSRKTLPACWEKPVSSWESFAKDENSGFSHVFWGDEDIDLFMRTYHDTYYEFWKSRKHVIQRIDIFRYFLLYTFGGIYTDCDLGLNVESQQFVRFFELYSRKDVALSESESSGRFSGIIVSVTNAFMMSKPKAKFWSTLFKMMKSSPTCKIKQFIGKMCKHFEIINSYGPGLVNDTMIKFLDDKKVIAIPKTLTAPGFTWSVKPFKTKESIVEVFEGSSWCDTSSTMMLALNKMYHFRDFVLVPIIMFLFILSIILLVFVIRLKR